MAKIKRLDDSAGYYHNEGVRYNNEGKYFDAIGMLFCAIERDERAKSKPAPATYSELAFAFYSLQLYPTAEKYYIKLLSLENRSEEAHIGLVRCSYAMGHKANAIFFINRAYSLGIFDSETDLSEFDDLFARDEKPRKKEKISVYDSDDNAGQLAFAQNLLKNNAYESARKVLDAIPSTSRQHLEVVDQLARIDIYEQKFEDALTRADYILEKDGDRLHTLLTKMIALYGLKEVEKARAVANQIAKLKLLNPYDDSELIANAMAKIEYDEMCEKFYQNCCSIYPYRPVMTTYLAITKFNLGKKDEAIELMRTLRVLYPSDTVISYYARLFKSDYDGGRLPIEFYLPVKEERERYDFIDQKLTQLSTVEATEKFVKENPYFEELLWWVLTYGKENRAMRIGSFLAQSEYFYPLFKDIFLTPDFPLGVKMEYLYHYLRLAKSKKISVYIGYNFTSESVNPPRVKDNLDMRDAYYKAYVVSLPISVNFKTDLNKAYREVVEKMNKPDFTPFKINEAEMATVLAYKGKTSEFFTSLSATAETMGADYDEVCRYMTALGYEIPEQDDEHSILRELEKLVHDGIEEDI